MADAFRECLAVTLQSESGLPQPVGGPYRRGPHSFMNHKKDPGGATMMGVTHRVYAAYRARMGMPPADVRDVTDREIEDIYYNNYWVLVRGDHLPPGLDLAVFDFGVNSGPGTAIRKLQGVLGVKVDGLIGIATINAAATCNVAETISALMRSREAFCRNLSNYPYFKGGWERRWKMVEQRALDRAFPRSPTMAVVPVEDAVSETPSPRAAEETPASMASSDTGNAAIVAGSGGVTTMGMTAAKTAKALTATGKPLTVGTFILELMSHPEFWAGIAVIFTASFVWIERRRKMRLEGA